MFYRHANIQRTYKVFKVYEFTTATRFEKHREKHTCSIPTREHSIGRPPRSSIYRVQWVESVAVLISHVQEEIAEVNETRVNNSGVASDQNSSSASDDSESVSFYDFSPGWYGLVWLRGVVVVVGWGGGGWEGGGITDHRW
jgi:hypothetical protein